MSAINPPAHAHGPVRLCTAGRPHRAAACSPRDLARLLVVRPDASGEFEDRIVRDLPALLRPGDAVVINDTMVFTAHLRGRRIGLHRQNIEPSISATLVKRLDGSRYGALWSNRAKRLAAGDVVRFGSEGRALLSRTARRDDRGEGAMAAR